MNRPASLAAWWTAILVWIALAVTGLGATRVLNVSKAQKPTSAQIAARRAELQQALEAYAAGDHQIVRRTIHERLDPITEAALRELLGDQRASWSPARAAFGLEAAVLLHRSELGGDITALIRTGRTMVMDRPNPIGADAAEDRFEMLWHQIALALVQAGWPGWYASNEYVTAVTPRMALMAKLTPPVPGRFALARASNASLQCCDALVLAMTSTHRGRPVVVTTEDARALFEQAASDPSLRAEALVRGAYFELQLGQLPEALAKLDRALPITDDMLAYAAAIIRASVFDRLEKPAAAAGAYAAAARVAPGAQVPAIGRAAALQRAGLIDDAVAEAGRARRLPDSGSDPWPTFLHGDARFISDWMLELRRMLK